MTGMEPREETWWITRAQRGDQAAFAKLVEAYERSVYNLCYRMLGDPFEAEDAAQETFLKAYGALLRYDRQRSFKTWLLSIASHHCIDRLRRKRLKLVPLLAGTIRGTGASQKGPEATFIDGELRHQLGAMLQRLNPKDRAAIILHYWYDLSYREIEETLGLSASAVRSRLYRARRELAQAWHSRERDSAAHPELGNEPSTV